VNSLKFIPIIIFAFFASIAFWGCELSKPKLDFGNSCKTCHVTVIQKDHKFKCVVCHKGNLRSLKKEEAHIGLIKSPSSIEGAKIVCAKCHPKEVETASRSLHYTLGNEIGTIWNAFFPNDTPPTVDGLLNEQPLMTLRGLISDMIRRRCVRCHVYSRGDEHPGTRRRLGCGACHMRPSDGPGVHRIYREVSDQNCLSCHHGNFVGWDYVGRFDKDITEAFQVPFRAGKKERLSFGVQWLEMTPDVHWRLGFKCTDCHKKGPCEANEIDSMPSCLDCHGDISTEIPGHGKDENRRVACSTCHALWAFEDRGRTLVRQDIANYWAWYDLRFQGIYDIKTLLENNYDVDFMYWTSPIMRDSFTGNFSQGVWYETFLERRFWPIKIGKDQNGCLRVFRPLLDIEVNYVDEDGSVIIEGLRPDGFSENHGFIPYSPHTIGKADIFRTLRVIKEMGLGNKKDLQ